MLINPYGLPEFISYSVLVAIACVLIRQQQDAQLRYWLAGWILILLHAGIFMLLPAQFPFDVLARGTLTIAGQAFMLAAYAPWMRAGTSLAQLGRRTLWGGLNLLFAVASAAYGEATIVGRSTAPFYLLILVCAGATLWLASGEKRRGAGGMLPPVIITAAIYGIQAAALYLYGVTMASQWAMCWTYLAVAYFFLRNAPRPTMGMIFTALSFVLWGLVFPVYSLLMVYVPAVSSNIESGVWNLPKFLAAASMILMLLEEKVARLTRLATHDELTGLPNRRLYLDRFEQAVARAARANSGFGFLVVDLDRFKLVNDTLGHQAGDELLRVVGARFAAALREIDTVARTGGDEFTVIVEGITSLRDAEDIAECLRRALHEPIAFAAGSHHKADASIGVALYPADGLTQLRLQAVADERMYLKKEQSRQSEAPPTVLAGAAMTA